MEDQHLSAIEVEEEVLAAAGYPGYLLPSEAGAELFNRGLAGHSGPEQGYADDETPHDMGRKLVLNRLDFGKLGHVFIPSRPSCGRS